MQSYLSLAVAFLIPILPNGAHIANAFTALHLHSSRVSCSSSTRHSPDARNISTKSERLSAINPVAESPSAHVVEQFLSQYENSLQEGQEWATEFGFSNQEGAFYAIFRAIRKMDSSKNSKLLGLSGTPFFIPRALLAKAEGGASSENNFSSYFHFPHLATALEEDFLDAQVGSTDNRKGWQVSAVSEPTGSSFDDARMTLSQVKAALEVSSTLLLLCTLIVMTSFLVYVQISHAPLYHMGSLFKDWDCHLQ